MLSRLQQKVWIDSIFQNTVTQLPTDYTQYKGKKGGKKKEKKKMQLGC